MSDRTASGRFFSSQKIYHYLWPTDSKNDVYWLAVMERTLTIEYKLSK